MLNYMTTDQHRKLYQQNTVTFFSVAISKQLNAVPYVCGVHERFLQPREGTECLICTPQHSTCVVVHKASNIMEISVNWFTGCSPMELWNLPAVGATFLSDVSILNDVARYPSCDAGSVGSAVLMNTTLDTATVAYYTRTTPGSRACFVCDKDSGYELTNNERICQSNSTWSGSPILCGMLSYFASICCAFSVKFK